MTAPVRLMIDAGNSRIKWMVVGPAGWDEGPPLSGPLPLEDELNRLWGSLEVPEAVALSCVAGPAVREAIVSWVLTRWGLEVFEAHSRASQAGLRSGYLEPQQLGTDRWLVLLGALRRHPGPALVVDLGTAISLDLVDGQGGHRGGYLLPGRQLMKSLLVERAFGVTLAEGPETCPKGPGQSTAEALSAGVLLGVRGAIEAIHARSCEDLGDNAQLILTGGDAAWMARHLSVPAQVDEALLFEGLWLQWNESVQMDSVHASPLSR